MVFCALNTDDLGHAHAHGAPGADAWLSAILVALVSFAALVVFREWEEWINFILGMWISVSPWILGFEHTAATRINLVVGILIAYLAILEFWLVHYRPPLEHTVR